MIKSDEFISRENKVSAHNYHPLPVVIEKGEGVWVWDTDGEMLTKWPQEEAVMNTKVVGKTLEAAHCLYAGSLEAIGQGTWMGEFKKDDPELFVVPEEQTLDIDYQWQILLHPNDEYQYHSTYHSNMHNHD